MSPAFKVTLSDFAILGKGFAQAQAHTVNSTRAGTSAIDSIHDCLSKTLSQDSRHGEIAFSISRDLIQPYFILKKKNIKEILLQSFL